MTLLGYQIDIKIKVNIIIFCFVSGTGGVVPSTQSVNSNNTRCNKRTGFPPSLRPHPHPHPLAIPPEITHLEETHSRFPIVHMLLPNGSGGESKFTLIPPRCYTKPDSLRFKTFLFGWFCFLRQGLTYYTSLKGLEFTMYPSLVLNSPRSTCFSLQCWDYGVCTIMPG